MMRRFMPLLALVGLSGFALADDTSDRANLIGAWQPQDSASASWTLQINGEEMHLTQMQHEQKASDFQCNTVARECDVKDAGEKLKVSMWYNGPKLVVQEIRGPKVLKYRFHALDRDNLELEVVPIVPDGKAQLLKFVRRTQSAAANH